MRAGRAVLDPADGKRAPIEVDLVPAQVHKLADAQAVPIGHKDHGRVAVAVAVAFDRLSQFGDLGVSQILPGPQFGVRPAKRRG
jgi:hypothetical protein